MEFKRIISKLKIISHDQPEQSKTAIDNAGFVPQRSSENLSFWFSSDINDWISSKAKNYRNGYREIGKEKMRARRERLKGKGL